MSDENIEIVVADKVSSSVSTKILKIAASADTAWAATEKLNSALVNLGNNSSISKLQSQLNTLNLTITQSTKVQNALSASQITAATSSAKVTQANAAAAVATQNLATATARTATAQSTASTAAVRLTTAQTQQATSAAKLATAQQQTATATSNAAAAQTRAQLAALRLQQAIERQNKAVNETTTSVLGYVKAIVGIVGTGLTASFILSQADAYTVLQNKLQNVTESQNQVNILTGRLYDLANETRSQVDATATSFARFDRALKILGKSQEDTLRLTETVNKALISSGATSSEASSALLQLSQAFNAGKLQGDEFRSVSENMPVVLDAVAKALNVPINQVKKFGTEGKITSKVLFDAFKLIETQVDATFAKTVPTIGQALTVLSNSTQRFFGEINKSLGITSSLSQLILALSKNMDALAIAATVAGTALLVYFGPNIYAAIVSATAAMRAFTIAIATNPIGLIVIAITAAISALVIFGDEIKTSVDGIVTIKDVALATLDFVKSGFATASDFIKAVWTTTFDYLSEATDGFGFYFKDFATTIFDVTKTALNLLINSWVSSFRIIVSVWQNFSPLMEGFFKVVANAAASAVEYVVNYWQTGLRQIADAAGSIAPEAAKAITDSLDKLTIKLPRFEISDASKDAAKEIKNIITEGFNTDYIGNAASAIAKRAKEIALTRKLQDGSGGSLRGAGKDTSGGIDNSKAIEARAKAMQKINDELNTEISRMFLLKPEREAQARFDQIEIALKQKKITLTKAEADSIKSRIKLIQDSSYVQAEFDRIYEESVSVTRNFTSTTEAANKLLASGAISQNDYARALTKATEVYKAGVDPLYSINRELAQQVELLNKIGPAQTIAQQMQQIQNQLLQKGVVLNAEETQQLQTKLETVQQQIAINQQLNQIYSETVGKQTELTQQTIALSQAQSQGIINADQYALAMNKLAVESANLRLQMQEGSFDDVLLSSAGTMLSSYNGVLSGLSESFGSFFVTLENGFADSIGKAIIEADNLNDALHDVATQALEGLISGLVKLGIQYVINAALGESIAASSMAASTAASVAAAAATGTAWAAPAALVSLASYGANSAPATAGILATTAVSEAVALSSLGGFKNGGYTGNNTVDEISGVVHGKEYVMDANSTKNIGVENLDALRSGAARVTTNTSAPKNNANANSQNNGNTKNANSQQPVVNLRTINVLDPTLVGEYMATPEGEQVLINTMRRNSDQVKAIVNG